MEDFQKVFKLQARLRSIITSPHARRIAVWLEEDETDECLGREKIQYTLEATLLIRQDNSYVAHKVATEYTSDWSAEQWSSFEDNCVKEFNKCLK